MEQLIIKDNNGSENISSALLQKIYETVLQTNNTLQLKGTIIVPHAKQSVLDYFEDNFPDLHITLTGQKYIEFTDPVVAWHVAKSYDPDGIGITQSDLNSINWITTSMQGNTQISSFNELSQFININTIKQEAFRGCTSLSSIDLSNITTLNDSAFRECSSLTSVNLSRLTQINNGNTFCGCTSLQSVTLNSALHNIGYEMFKNCTSLQSIDLSNITSIGYGAFKGCTALSNVTWPSSDFIINGSIDNGAFKNCTSLTSVDLTNCTSVGVEAFMGCTNLGLNQSIDLNLDNISLSVNCFRNTGYKTVVLHETTKHQISSFSGSGQLPSFSYMDKMTVFDCSDTKQTAGEITRYSNGMTTLVLPETYTTPNYATFGRDSSSALKYIIILATTPPTIPNQTNYIMYGVNANCAMYVPDSAYNDYINTWGTVVSTNKIKKLSELPVGVWKTGLYQQYEPYLSNSSDPAYQTS